ncbi:MAG: hypothetical protein WCA81_05820 [Rhizomicrobium sp.]
MTIAEERAVPSVGTVISLSWRSCCDAATKMPFTFLTAWIVCLLLPLAQAAATAHLKSQVGPWHSNFLTQLTVRGEIIVLTAGLFVVLDVVLASVAITIHRFILLGEEKSGIFALTRRRTWRFVGWLLFFDVLLIIGHLPIDFSEDNSRRYNVLYVIYLIVLLIVGGRSMVLFPAVAIDVPSSRWQERLEKSWQETSGRLATIVFSYVGSVIPLILVILAASLIPIIPYFLYAIIGKVDETSLLIEVGVWTHYFSQTFVEVASTAAAAAVASWIYKSARNVSQIADS